MGNTEVAPLGYTWEKLTEAQLIGAAHDLRNAALVVKHAGHFKGALVNAPDGSVCAVGAVELATYKTLHTGMDYYWAEGYDDAGAARSEAAIIALAAMIPLALCKTCDPETLCECGCGQGGEQEPFQIVTHYNDNHCTGGQLAVNMMRLAAANAEVFAEIKRKELVPA